ncbi:MAG: glycoside hydrolase family 6 protein [Solirubrobacteraceae bacterium]
MTPAPLRATRSAVLAALAALCLLCTLGASAASARNATPLAPWGGTSAANPVAGVKIWREGPRWGLAAGQIAQWLGYSNPRASSVFGDQLSWDGFSRLVSVQKPRIGPDAQHKIDLMMKVASQPETKRFGGFSGSGWKLEDGVRRLLQRAEQNAPSQVPQLSIYRLNHVRCGGHSDSSADAASYRAWINRFVAGIGRRPAVVFLEQDALITTPCLSHGGLTVRMGEMRYAAQRLAALPHVVAYMDAGASDAVPAGRTVQLLRSAGVRYIHGFFLNSTHFSWTSSEMTFGRRVSRGLGGTHFAVNTAVNGNGPLRPASRVRSGNEVLCNPAGRALGPRPTTATGDPRVDAFVWIGNIGRSGGKCGVSRLGTGTFDPDLALGLASRANERLGPAYPSRPY